MRRIAIFTTFFIFCFTAVVSAQENTLEDQMTEVFDKSNSYQKYKVIEQTKLATLRRNVLDSVSELQTTIVDQHIDIANRTQTIDSLNLQLEGVKNELEASKEREDGIQVLGVLTSKSTYNTLMWSIIIVLLLLTIFFFYRSSASHQIIRDTRQKVDELDAENENLRRTNLEREQKLRRKLQDEINKNKSSL